MNTIKEINRKLKSKQRSQQDSDRFMKNQVTLAQKLENYKRAEQESEERYMKNQMKQVEKAKPSDSKRGIATPFASGNKTTKTKSATATKPSKQTQTPNPFPTPIVPNNSPALTKNKRVITAQNPEEVPTALPPEEDYRYIIIQVSGYTITDVHKIVYDSIRRVKEYNVCPRIPLYLKSKYKNTETKSQIQHYSSKTLLHPPLELTPVPDGVYRLHTKKKDFCNDMGFIGTPNDWAVEIIELLAAPEIKIFKNIIDPTYNGYQTSLKEGIQKYLNKKEQKKYLEDAMSMVNEMLLNNIFYQDPSWLVDTILGDSETVIGKMKAKPFFEKDNPYTMCTFIRVAQRQFRRIESEVKSRMDNIFNAVRQSMTVSLSVKSLAMTNQKIPSYKKYKKSFKVRKF